MRTDLQGKSHVTEILDVQREHELMADGLEDVEGGCAFLHISRATMYTLLGREIPYVKIGRAVRIPKRALRDYAAKQLAGARE